MNYSFFQSRAMRLAACVAFAAGISAVTAAAQSEEEVLPDVTTGNTPGAALFQYAALAGSGSTITAVWVPVTVKGVTKYENVTIPLQFAETPTGQFVVTAGTPTLSPSPTPQVNGFKPGTYKGPTQIEAGEMGIAVAGPGTTVNGATIWTYTSAGTAGCIYPSNGYWYDGPLAGNPLAARVKAAGIVNASQWSFGLLGDQNCGWYTNSLLGFSQVGNTITIADFTNGEGDHSLPVDTITYTKTTP